MPLKVVMKEQMGVRDFCYAKVKKNDETGYEADEVKSGGWLAKVTLSVTEEATPIWRDNVNAKEKRSIAQKEITIDTSLLPFEVRADLLGETVDKDGLLLGGGGRRKAPLVAVGYVMGDTEDDEEYVWWLVGTFSLPGREASTRNEGADSNGQELVFKPVDTLFAFANGGVRDSVSCMSTNEKYGKYCKDKWFNQVVTPDNASTVLVASTSA